MVRRKGVTKKFNPWKRHLRPHNEGYITPSEKYYFENLRRKRPNFMRYRENRYVDSRTIDAVLLACPFVVSLISYSGDMEMNQGVGTIIESNEGNINIVLTSARLFTQQGNTKRQRVADVKLADNLKVVVRLFDGRSFEGGVCGHNFYYNIAAIRFESDSILPTAILKRLDDSLDLNPRQIDTSSFRLHRHSSSIKLMPGDFVVAAGRYFAAPYEIMAAPGVFSANRCEGHGCKELFNSTSRMTRCGDGSPLVNLAGEVIGIGFYDNCFTPFLPINMAYKWWEFYKRDGEKLRRPSLGLEVTNFYNAEFDLAKIIERFPSISKGVVVEKVFPGSSAECAGLRGGDVIIECAEKVVQSFLEFLEILWDHVGLSVDLVVFRKDLMKRFKMIVVESASDEINCWPSLER